MTAKLTVPTDDITRHGVTQGDNDRAPQVVSASSKSLQKGLKRVCRDALHLHAGEELAIEVEGERIVLTRAPAEFRALRVAYRTLGQCIKPQIAS
jgi:hypothetical protein